MVRLASISIDLDGFANYEAIHGLPHASCSDAVARLAPPRLATLLDEVAAKGTFFAIGREIPAGGEPLRGLASVGHEIGNHTLDHPYALTRLPAPELLRQIEGGAAAIAAATGVRPEGFRAPGYTLSPGVLEAVHRSGHRYDSSVFPAAPYYLAKASILAWQRVRGRASAAILDRPGVLLAPLQPYRPAAGDPYARGAHPIFELPMAIDPILRLPLIGTVVVGFPLPVVRAIYASVRRRPFLNLELHGMDLLEPADGMSLALANVQRDHGLPLTHKLARLREILRWIARDYRIVTLAEAARQLG